MHRMRNQHYPDPQRGRVLAWQLQDLLQRRRHDVRERVCRAGCCACSAHVEESIAGPEMCASMSTLPLVLALLLS